MVSEELCVIAALTTVILSVIAKHQTDNQADSLYGGHLLSASKSQIGSETWRLGIMERKMFLLPLLP